MIDDRVISSEIGLWWMSLDLTDDKSTLVQVINGLVLSCLSQCWPRSMSPNGVTRPHWVKTSRIYRKWNITTTYFLMWWNFMKSHDMEAFSTLLALCAGNPLSGFPAQRPFMHSFDSFFVVSWDKLLNTWSNSQWNASDTSRPAWHHVNSLRPSDAYMRR